MTNTSLTLLEQLQQRDNRIAWQRMLAIYEPLLRQWLNGQHLPSSDIDDLLQDVFVVVCQNMVKFDHNGRIGAFRHWLKAIVVNRSKEFWRRGRLRSMAVATQSMSLFEQMEDPRSDLSLWWDREHDCSVVRRVLAQIHADFAPHVWEIFRLSVLENLPGSEVARQTGVALNTIYAAKFRVLERLRQELHGWIDV